MLTFASAASAGTILVYGDSLSAAHGLADVAQGWVPLLQQRLQRERLPYTVVNDSISGETSAGGLERLNGALDRYHPTIMVLELGANDGLRGLSLDMMKHNLGTMVQRAKARGIEVVLVGMFLPSNYGEAYTKRFHEIYLELAHDDKLPLVPFLLQGVALDPKLMQDDGLHPNAAAQPKLLDTVWPVLEPLLRSRH